MSKNSIKKSRRKNMWRIYEDEKVEVFSFIPPEYRDNIIDLDVLHNKANNHYGKLAYITGPGPSISAAQFKAVEKEHIEDVEDYLLGVLQ